MMIFFVPAITIPSCLEVVEITWPKPFRYVNPLIVLCKIKPQHTGCVTRLIRTLRVLTLSFRAGRGVLQLGGLRFPCSLGRSGTSYLKREGDGASPKGSWQLRRLFYRADRLPPPRSGLAPRALQAGQGWCETVGDRNYNRRVPIPYATAHETMRRADHLYDIVIETSHNERPRVQGHGSAVFFHLRKADGGPTAGCIAVSLRDMRIILQRVGPGTRLKI
jgi:L,D-peptidoglycan transpeptidase YkuD (ErfK/YbiS/YcfS/YnhG family)